MTDKSALNARIIALTSIQQGNYTDNSWNAFHSALVNAKSVVDKENVSQTEIDVTLSALNNAYAGLTQNKNYIKLWGNITKYESNFWNWFLCIGFFGWIWMAF